MKIYEILNKATLQLSFTNKKLAFKECETLLLSVINKTKEYLYQNFRSKIKDKSVIKKFFQKINDRIKGIPIQYLTNYEVFYGRKFFVRKGVFIPRQDTETLIEATKKLDLNENMRCIDIGCGSGCIGITLKLEIPKTIHITFIDNNKTATNTTKKNLRLYNIKGEIYTMSFFNFIRKINDKFDIAVCNPPYISYKSFKTLDPEIKYEPKTALLAKKNGYDFYIKLASVGNKFLKPSGYLILEAGYKMAERIKKIFSNKWNYLYSLMDLNNIERCIVFQLKY